MTDIKEHIADEAKRITSGGRRKTYGMPEDNFQRIATMWNAYLNISGRDAAITPIDVAAMMRLMKEARLVETPGHLDSFIDIVGYALCGAETARVEHTPQPVHTSDDALKQRNQELELALENAKQRIIELKRVEFDPALASISGQSEPGLLTRMFASTDRPST